MENSPPPALLLEVALVVVLVVVHVGTPPTSACVAWSDACLDESEGMLRMWPSRGSRADSQSGSERELLQRRNQQDLAGPSVHLVDPNP